MKKCDFEKGYVPHNKSHGKAGTSIYGIWNGMIMRCYNPKRKSYKHYGGRGIEVDPKWRTFEGFFEDVGDRPEGMTIERIDPNGNYTKSNVKWASQEDQQNNRRNNRTLECNGKTQTIRQWEKELGFARGVLWARLQKMTLKEAVESPMQKTGLLTAFGITKHKNDWCEWSGIKLGTLNYRLLAGWTTEKALTEPVKKCPS